MPLSNAEITNASVTDLLGKINYLWNAYETQGLSWDEDALVEWQLAREILKLLPDELVRFGARVCFGDGKCSRKQAKMVNQFRQSDRAKILYRLWRGKEYEATNRVEIPNSHSHRVTIFHIEV